MSDHRTPLERFIDERKRKWRVLRTIERFAQLPQTRRQLANLYDGLSEHDSDCAWHRNGACDCGAEDFARKFAAWAKDAPR